MTIEEFIEARIAERETAASEAVELEQKYTPEGCSFQWVKMLVKPDGRGQGSYTFEPDPHEVLRQCAALRQAVEAARLTGTCSPDAWTLADEVLAALARMWSNHPDYQQEWAK